MDPPLEIELDEENDNKGGNVSGEDTVAILGAGTIGLASLLIAKTH